MNFVGVLLFNIMLQKSLGVIASSVIEQTKKSDILIPDYRNHLPQPDNKKSSNEIDKNGIEAIKSFNMNGSNLRKIPSHSSLLQFYPHSRFRSVVHSSGRHHPDAITSIDDVPAPAIQQFGNSNNFDVKSDKLNLKSIKSNEKVTPSPSSSNFGPSGILTGNSNFSFGNSNDFDVKKNKLNFQSIKSNEKVTPSPSSSNFGSSGILAGNSNFSFGNPKNFTVKSDKLNSKSIKSNEKVTPSPSSSNSGPSGILAGNSNFLFGNPNNFDVRNDQLNLKSIKSNEKVTPSPSASDLRPSDLLAGNSNFLNNYLSQNRFVSNNNDNLISLNDKNVNLSFIKSLLTNKVIYKLLEFILSIIDVIMLSPFHVTYKKIQPQSLGLNDEVKPTESSFVQRVEINPEMEVVDKTQNKLKQNSWKHDKACNKSVKLRNSEKVKTKFNVKNSSTVNAHKTLLVDYLNMNSLSKIRQVNSQRSRLDSCKGSSRQVCSSTTSLLQSSQLEHKERDNIDNQYLHKKIFINKDVGTKSHKCKSKTNKVDLKKSLPVEFEPTRLVDNHKRVFGNFYSNKKNINYNKKEEFKFLKKNSAGDGMNANGIRNLKLKSMKVIIY
ncbi:homeobox protein 2-like [Microplitis mediator]|uniref:homeobox protein 2-like n=1 Tax=Microplitis mediator TaxID=375433 RepID=UPI0025564810|nr:homeobox protein 2-like [Microplitis mediator]